MAMETPVVATSAAMEGIFTSRDSCSLVADDPAEYAGFVKEILTHGDTQQLGKRGRDLVIQTRAWEIRCRPLANLLDGMQSIPTALHASA